MPDIEDAALRECCEQPFRDDPIVLQEVFQGPEGELGIIGRKPDRPTVGVGIWLVAADGMPGVRKLPFSRVPERVADGYAEQHVWRDNLDETPYCRIQGCSRSSDCCLIRMFSCG
jgi:hypothetical protein